MKPDVIVVEPIAGPLSASVAVPGSKSIANRALVCAALAQGTSTIDNLPDGDDVQAMLAALAALTTDVEYVAAQAGAVRISGWDGPPSASATLHAGLAGTTSRFLTAVAALGSQPIAVDGDEPLRQRPFAALFDALDQLGVTIEYGGRPGHLPATLTGPPVGRGVRLPGNISSQFISALMLIAPVLSDGLTIDIDNELVSRPYVELTAAVMARFGAGVELDDHHIQIGPGGYRATELTVEPDASSASYPLGLAAIVGGRVEVPGLGNTSRQGDVGFAEVLAAMGCEIAVSADSVTVSRPVGRELVGIDIDMADISDLVPTVAAVAAFASTPTTIRGVGFIRGKESDRLGDLSRELTKLGVAIDETADGVEVGPSRAHLHRGRVDTHHDHRLAMAAALVGAGAAGAEIESPSVVAKSWPGFWDMLATLTASPKSSSSTSAAPESASSQSASIASSRSTSRSRSRSTSNSSPTPPDHAHQDDGD